MEIGRHVAISDHAVDSNRFGHGPLWRFLFVVWDSFVAVLSGPLEDFSKTDSVWAGQAGSCFCRFIRVAELVPSV